MCGFTSIIEPAWVSLCCRGEDALKSCQRLGVTLEVHALGNVTTGETRKAWSIGDDTDRRRFIGATGRDLDGAVVNVDGDSLPVHLDVVDLVEADRRIRVECRLEA